ncbi:hypothetical protein T190115A13A_60198 [Tenacibaculum sp. 190524A02b]|uniref:Uncharacterized protein n=2 Tax=Tenacibaculum vairaonense TaxID=3137860 RepID=A0ABM9PQY1_9FLAO
MTCSVALGSFEAPQIVINQLKEIESKGITLNNVKEYDYPDAFAWLNTTIYSSDAYQWEYELNDLSI